MNIPNEIKKLLNDGWSRCGNQPNYEGEYVFRRMFEKCEQFVSFNSKFRMVGFYSKNMQDSDDYYLITREFDENGNLTFFKEVTPSKDIKRTFLYSAEGKIIKMDECVDTVTYFDASQKAITPRDILNKTNHRNLF